MRKTLAFVGIIAGGLSFIMIVGKNGVPVLEWLLGTASPFILLTSLIFFLKEQDLWTLMVPSLFYYGVRGFFSVQPTLAYAFGIACSVLMFLMVFYILFMQLIKFRIFRTGAIIVMGIILFMGVDYIRIEVVEERPNHFQKEAKLFSE